MVNRMSPPADFSLEHDAFGRLVLTMPDGQRHVGVHPVRGFPISDPRAGWRCAAPMAASWCGSKSSINFRRRRRAHGNGTRSREFLPVIKRIYRVSLQTNPCEWEVETDRGPTKFLLKSEDDVRRLEDHRAR